MVLPYLKGLINKEAFHIISGFICIVLYFYIRSIIFLGYIYNKWYQSYNKWYQSTFLGTKVENFFYYFLQGFLGGEFADQICMFW